MKRHLHKLTEETLDNWTKVLPRSLMRAQTTPKKEGLSPFECIYLRSFLWKDIVIDPEALGLTSYVTQLSAFQQALTELQEMTPDTCKPLFEPGTKVLIKTLGSGGSSLDPLWKGLYQVIISSPTAAKVPEIDSWVHHTRVKSGHPDQNEMTSFYVFTFCALTLYFSVGLIIYVSLPLLPPKIPSLHLDPQDNAFLTWAQSYTEFHNQSNCWVCEDLWIFSISGRLPVVDTSISKKRCSPSLQRPSTTISCNAC